MCHTVDIKYDTFFVFFPKHLFTTTAPYWYHSPNNGDSHLFTTVFFPIRSHYFKKAENRDKNIKVKTALQSDHLLLLFTLCEWLIIGRSFAFPSCFFSIPSSSRTIHQTISSCTIMQRKSKTAWGVVFSFFIALHFPPKCSISARHPPSWPHWQSLVAITINPPFLLIPEQKQANSLWMGTYCPIELLLSIYTR